MITNPPATRRPDGTRRRQVLLVLLTLGVLLGAAAPGAGAANGRPADPPGAARSVQARENNDALGHWTAERMRDARPTTPGLRPGGPAPAAPDTGRPETVPPAAPAGEDVTATALSGTATALSTSTGEGYWQGSNTANPNRQIGRLFFQTYNPLTRSWRDSWCTGTVVNSENKSVVWTAGHCVFETHTNQWNRNYVFCPGYRNGSCPLGRWTPYSQHTTNQWVSAVCLGDGRCNTSEFQFDLGALRMNTLNGTRIANWVGAQGIQFNGALYQYRNSFGYPGNKSSGQYLYLCPGNNSYTGGNLYLACTAGGGASGGPWLSGVSSTWFGTVHSVNSHGGTTTMGGPYQGSVAQSLFNGIRY
jgi:V8-like Glu-specific endopeptidase